jgi:hypothetical protein
VVEIANLPASFDGCLSFVDPGGGVAPDFSDDSRLSFNPSLGFNC